MNGLTKKQKAKKSLNLEETVFKIPNNFKPVINRYIFDKWQTSWNETPFNKLKEIKPVIKESKSVISNIRREEVVLTRLRIEHTRNTHSWLLNRDEQPNCTGCDVPFTVKHFLLDCFDVQPRGGGGITNINLVQVCRWASTDPPYKCRPEYGKGIPINVYTITNDNKKCSLLPFRWGSFI